MTDPTLLWASMIASVALAVAAFWWARNGWEPLRGFGAVILAGAGVMLGYIVVRSLLEGS